MDKTQGYYNLARFIGKNYAETDELRCIRVFIPDGDEYTVQLMTLINVAATRAAWWTDTDEQRIARAEIWQRAYEETLMVLGEGCMDCSWILECLDNPAFVDAMDDFIASLLQNANSATSQALTQIMQQQINNAQGYPLSASASVAPLNQVGETCDHDELWGSCLNTVVTLNRLNVDFMETVAAAANNQEAISYIVGAIPVLETLPIDELVQLAAKINAFVKEFYEAGYDKDLETEMACELYCRAVENDCVLNMELLKEYFWTEAEQVEGFEDAFQTALTIIQAMANWQEMLGEQIVIIMMACNVGFLSFLNSALGMSFGNFQLKAKAGIPDDDWELCECGDTWACDLDFTTSSYGFASYGGFQAGNGGSWVDGVGLVGAYGRSANNAYKMVQMSLTVDSCTVTKIAVTEFDLTNGFHSAGAIPAVIFEQVDVLEQSTAWFPDGNNQSYEWMGENTGTTLIGWRIQAGYRTSFASDPGGTVVIRKARITGTGTKPSQLP